MSFDGSDPCWIPTVPIGADQDWRMNVAKFNGGYEQRQLDGINALARTWSLQWQNRTASDLTAMADYLTNVSADAFPFRDPGSQIIYNVFCNSWSIAWAPARRQAGAWVYYGTLSAEFQKANGAGLVSGGPGGGITFVADGFDSPNGTPVTGSIPEVGGSWADYVANGSPGLIEDERFCPRGNPNIYSNAAAPTSPDYYVQGVFDYVTDGVTPPAGDVIGIAGRMQPGANTYYRVRWAANAWTLAKVVNGGVVQLGAPVTDTFTTGTRIVRLDMRGTTIRLLIGGVQRAAATDASIAAAGLAGIYGAAASNVKTGRHLTSVEAVNY